MIVRHHKGLQALLTIRAKKATTRKITWYWGPTGTGKTRAAVDYAMSSGKRWYICDVEGSWFGNYSFEQILIIDEYDSGQISASKFLRLTDRYPMEVPVKGSFIPLCASEIFITSHHHPKIYFLDDRWAEVERRILESGGSIIECKKG